MINDGKPLTPAQLVRANIEGKYGSSVRMTELVTNIILNEIDALRKANRPATDGICMTALAVAAGIIQGELEGEKITPELEDKTRDTMLVENFKAGRSMGLQHVEAVRAAKLARAADKAAAGRETRQ